MACSRDSSESGCVAPWGAPFGEPILLDYSVTCLIYRHLTDRLLNGYSSPDGNDGVGGLTGQVRRLVFSDNTGAHMARLEAAGMRAVGAAGWFKCVLRGAACAGFAALASSGTLASPEAPAATVADPAACRIVRLSDIG